MTNRTPSILLIDRGDMPSLAAVVTVSDPSRIRLWHPAEPGVAGPARGTMARAHADLLEAPLTCCDAAGPWGDGPAGGEPGDGVAAGLAQALLLVHASIAAREHGCGRIVWPVQVGSVPSRVCATVDRATTIAELAAADLDPAAARPGTDLAIDLPLVDLDDRQVVDLADDAGAPLTAFWPCEAGGREPCRQCSGCDRWRRAFRELGLPWPWAAVEAGAGR